jgi:hypothetical protein
MAYSDIKDPSAYFQTALYTGNNTANHAITNDGNSDLQPDLLWIKSRDAAHSHWLVDSNRGVTKGFFVESSDAERTSLATRDVASFDTDGFTVGVPYHSSSTNSNASTKVAWQWKANGGTTSSNTDGNITSTVQSNQDAGFSIVTYTGNGSNNQTIGHGLGVQPSWWVVKNRSGGSTNWLFGASSILGGTSNYLKLNDNSANTEYNNIWGDSPTSSTLFRVSNVSHLNTNGSNYVAYLFANKQGYSKFGKYVGNGSTDGPFVYTGFKPAFVILKRTNTTSNWIIMDNKRNTFNEMESRLFPNLDSAEQTQSTYGLDFLSNGFKLRDTVSQSNGSGSTYIYIAFAENPFVAGGIPTTAR